MESTMGQIIWFAFDFEVNCFMKCDGRSLPINVYTALFSLMGTKYGGDGVNSFNIPDLSTETGSYQICTEGYYPSRR